MNGWGKLSKTIRSKKSKKGKNQSEIATCEQKPQARKRIFTQTPLKLEQKNFTSQNHWLLRFTSCFGVTKNHYSNLTSKIMKICEQNLRKDSAPIQFKFFEL